MWTDYSNLFGQTVAIMNGFIAVIVAQFYKDRPTAKVILISIAGALSAIAIGATFYNQHLIVVERDAREQRVKEIRDSLGEFYRARS